MKLKNVLQVRVTPEIDAAIEKIQAKEAKRGLRYNKSDIVREAIGLLLDKIAKEAK